MTIKDLIQEAINKSPEFSRKAYYWFEYRKRGVDLDWLMINLERVLGKEYVRSAAKAEVEKMRVDANGEPVSLTKDPEVLPVG